MATIFAAEPFMQQHACAHRADKVGRRSGCCDPERRDKLSEDEHQRDVYGTFSEHREDKGPDAASDSLEEGYDGVCKRRERTACAKDPKELRTISDGIRSRYQKNIHELVRKQHVDSQDQQGYPGSHVIREPYSPPEPFSVSRCVAVGYKRQDALRKALAQ